MNNKRHCGSIRLAVLICLLLLAFAPSALAACKDSNGKKYKDHSWGKWKVTQEATCEKAGKQVRTCKHCGKKQEKTIEATGHSWGKWKVTKEATCEKAGKQVRTCKLCKKKQEKTIEATGHSWGKWVVKKEATCTEAGRKVRTCKTCKEKESVTIEATGHDWGKWVIKKEATCTEAGRKVRTCKTCKEKEKVTIEALGHDWGEWVIKKEATCTEAGRQVRTCKTCKEKERVAIEALGHTWGKWKVTKEATCEEAGEKTHTCKTCKEAETVEIEALGHTWGEWTVTKEATCEAAGEKTHTCKTCKTEETAEIEATGHTWGDWTTVTEATCEAAGKKTRVCTVCGEEQEEVIEATGHQWSAWTSTTEATCGEMCTQTRTCEICGKTEEKAGEALEHDWGEWTTSVEPTCTEAGKQTRTCARCGETQEQALEALGHSYETVTTEATCTEPGTVTTTCSRCGDSTTETLEALGHDWGEWVVEKDATETEPGIRVRTCARCYLEEMEETAPAERTGAEESTAYTVTLVYIGQSGEQTQVTQSCAAYSAIDTSAIPATVTTDSVQYTLTGWSPALDTSSEEALTEDVTFTAQYSAAYAVTFKYMDEDGSWTEADPQYCATFADIEEPAVTESLFGTNDSKATVLFTFTGWSPSLDTSSTDALTGALTYTAQYSQTMAVTALEFDAVECYTFKPALKAALKLLPAQASATATLGDGTTVTLPKVTLTWDKDSCPDYGDAADDISGNGEYVFTAASCGGLTDAKGNTYVLYTDVEAACTLIVGPDTSGHWLYQIDGDGNAVITGWDGKGMVNTILTVPATLKSDKYAVVALADEALKGKTKPTQVVLPAGLTAIGDSAFEGCTALTTLAVPAGVTSVGESAFAGCTALTALTLPDSLTSIGEKVVEGDTALTGITFSASLASTLTSATTFEPAAAATETTEDEETTTAVTLPLPVTDIQVYSLESAPFTLSCDWTVAEGHAVTVAAGAMMQATGSITNQGTITNAGTLTCAALSNAGTVLNSGSLTCTGTWTNSGTFESTGTLIMQGSTAENTGTLTLQADSVTKVAVDCTLTNTGTVANSGTVNCYGTIVTCGGTWSGTSAVKKKSGTIHSEHDYQLTESDDSLYYVCSRCGAQKAFTPFKLNMKYKGPEKLTKVFDTYPYVRARVTDSSGNSTIRWFTQDLDTSKYYKITKQKGYEDVKYSAVATSNFSSADAGDYTIYVRVYFKGDDARYYDLGKDSSGNYYVDMKLPATIQPRPVTFVPQDMGETTLSDGTTRTLNLYKTYGQSDPGMFWGKFKEGAAPLKAAETSYTGRLSRETGENVGRYKITQGTFELTNKNYALTVETAYFVINPKPITDSDIEAETILSQTYTGKALKPTVTLKRRVSGSTTRISLKEGTDYTVEYRNNTNVGSAQAIVTGKGNYTGTRTIPFSIVKTTSTFGGGSSSTDFGYRGFDDGDDLTDTDEDFFGDEDDEDGEGGGPEDGVLVLNDVDYGTILFGAQGDARPFTVFEDEAEDELVPEDEDAQGTEGAEGESGGITLTIIPDPMVDEATGEPVLLEDGIRERFSELHLRLDVATTQTMQQQGIGEIVYEFEQASVRIPLAAMTSLLQVGQPELPEEANDPETLTVEDADELVLEDADAEIEEIDEIDEAEEAEELGELPGQPVSAGLNALQVMTYDICLEQADATGLTERETALLESGDLLLPAYRVRVSVVPQGTEAVPTGLTDDDGEPILQRPSQPLPEGCYPEGLVMDLVPDESLITAPEGIQLVYASAVNAPTDPDVTETTPAVFADHDGMLAAQVPLKADGLYAVLVPEGVDLTAYLEDVEDIEEFADDEEDFGDEEDLDDDDEDFEDDEDFGDEEDFDDDGDFEDDEDFDDEDDYGDVGEFEEVI